MYSLLKGLKVPKQEGECHGHLDILNSYLNSNTDSYIRTERALAASSAAP